jgi:hypothetical protein
MNHTGWVWVHGKGANITGDQKHAWDLFIKTHKEAAPYWNKDWVHYDAMAQIMPSSTAGKHVFAPASGGTQPSSFEMQAEEVCFLFYTVLTNNSFILIQSDDGGDTTHPTSDNIAPTEHASTSSPAPAPATTSASAAASRKRERAEPSTPVSKRTKVTGSAAAISGLTKSIDTFGDKVCAALSMDPELRTPHCHKQALARCQKEEWLPLDDRLLLYDILEEDSKAVDAYTMIDPNDQEFREEWINRKLNKAKGLGGSWM